MSDKNKNSEFFRNEDTLMRRAWIECALDGVRSSLESGLKAMEFGEPVVGPNLAAPDVRSSRPASAPAIAADAALKRPALYVAWSAGGRRARR